MIYNASGVTGQHGNFCFECMTLYTFLAFKYSILCPKKVNPFYFCDYSVKCWPMLIIIMRY